MICSYEGIYLRQDTARSIKMSFRQDATGMVLDMTRQERFKMIRAGTWLLILILPTTALGVDKPTLPVITHYEMKMRVALAEARVESACRLTIKNIADKPLKVIVLLLNPGFTVLQDTLYLDGQSHSFRQKEKGMEGYGSVKVNTVKIFLPEHLPPRRDGHRADELLWSHQELRRHAPSPS